VSDAEPLGRHIFEFGAQAGLIVVTSQFLIHCKIEKALEQCYQLPLAAVMSMTGCCGVGKTENQV